MESDKRLSVIIPAYNAAATLQECLESVLCQQVEGMEIIVVDDGSNDGETTLMAEEYARRDSRISLIKQANQGLSAARNSGINRAKGQWITFVDSDDSLAPGTLPAILATAEQGNYDLTEYSVDERYNHPKHASRLQLPDREYDSAADYWLEGHAYEHCYAWNKLYRRQLFLQTRYEEHRLFEDVFILPKLLHQAKHIRTCSQGTYRYRYNSGGITATAGKKALADLLEAHLRVLPRWADKRYYAHILNIQLDSYEAGNTEIKLPTLPYHGTAKLLLLRILGMKRLCQLNKTLHRIARRNR